MRRHALAVVVVPFVLAACQTITEELPTRPGPVTVGGGPVSSPAPVVVVPVPIPSPTPPPANTNPAPAPAPTTQPAPTPTAQPAPQPTPPPSGGGPGGQVPTNTSPAVRLNARVYFVECNGQKVADAWATEAPVGCRIHFDVTPRDAGNEHTQVRQTPRWTFSPASIVNKGSDEGFNPTVTAKAVGTLTAWAEADGIRSNDVVVRLR